MKENYHGLVENNDIYKSLRIAILLTFSSGILDAVTYTLRGGVFTFAQTGNIIVFAVSLAGGLYTDAAERIIPIISAILGYATAEMINIKSKSGRWREYVMLMEVLLIASSSFIPSSETLSNIVANTILSFSSAMQYQAFRSLRGKSYASTMFTGNLRSMSEALTIWAMKKDEKKRNDGLDYLFILISFILGILLGAFLLKYAGTYTVLCSSLIMLLTLFYIIIVSTCKRRTE